ncbi:MAG: hypothetical protein NC124_17800 [Clostridium sp.]|nr:hypothetical protein [Clostridium sp.]
MSSKKKKNENTLSQSNVKPKSKKWRKKIFNENAFSTIVITVISEMIFALIIFFSTNVKNLFSIPTIINQIQEDVNKISNSTIELESSIKDIKEKYYDIDKRLSIVEYENGLYPSVMIDASEELIYYIKETVIHHNSQYASEPPALQGDILGSNADTGESIFIENVINQPITVFYKENDQITIFCGEINNNRYWDGDCILNVYEGNILKSIVESVYVNGNIDSYNQLIRFTTNADVDVWSLSYRKSGENYDSGESWHYIYCEYLQPFNYDSLSPNDIVDIQTFKNYVSTYSRLEGYYCGNIVNGKYSDHTGKAQRIIYSEDGTVRLLYIGNFEDGQLNDTTGNAWCIMLGYDNETYYYYKGNFVDAKRENDIGLVKISVDEIKKLIEGITFKCELSWYNEIY